MSGAVTGDGHARALERVISLCGLRATPKRVLCGVHYKPRCTPHSETHFRRPNPNESLLVAVLPALPGGVEPAGGGGLCWSSGSAWALIATVELGLSPKELELLLSDAPPASPAAMASTLALAALTLSP